MAEFVRYDVTGAVARIMIDRPDVLNAISWVVVRELRDVFARAASDDSVRVVVLTGAGDRAFCAGADLGTMAGGDVAAMHEARGGLAQLFLEMWGLGKPTIARVRGYALAGGMGLALACDFVVAADDAQFGTPEIDLGLWPYMITVPLLRSMPPKVVLELMLTGRRVDSAEAGRIGFVNRVVPVDELDGAVNELAATLASKPPSTVKLGRDSFYNVLDLAAAPALEHLHAMLSITTETADAKEGLAARAEKRPPRWQVP
jgi:enoyl-CoA hydratase/carnithine racemase